jgi:4-hydroxy-4-methyl-2-oxoglutarate aldolase
MDEVAGRLLAFDTCAVSDALDSLGLKGVVTGLIAPVRHLGAASIDAAAPGEIIVVEQRTGCEAGSWGGVLTRAAQHKGVAAVISDGLLRDVDEVREIDFPVFCRGFTAFTARGRIHETATEVPVSVGDVTVSPGDYVLADSSACVFIAAANAEAVIEAASRILRRESEMIRRIEAGESAGAVLGANYEHMLEKDSL